LGLFIISPVHSHSLSHKNDVSFELIDLKRTQLPSIQLISDDPEAYRMKKFDGSVPKTLKGATVVDLQEVQKLHKEGNVIFIDVTPHLLRPANLPKEEKWDGDVSRSIPGGYKLANVGYGRLTHEMQAYFRNHLGRISKGEPSQPILFYCKGDPWQSWNAAKRALSLGYKSVYWFPLGTEEWVKAGGSLEDSWHPPMPKQFFD
jgi:PQQ-dependent catabolism-associated CXXCW motif protein